MHLTLIKNPDESKQTLYKIARVIYAETNASSLIAVEALAAMIANLCVTSKRELADLIADERIFESLNKDSSRHSALTVETYRKDFQMCLRAVQKMINGNLPDLCNGAIRFHRNELLPEWAVARGYVAEIDGLLFYL